MWIFDTSKEEKQKICELLKEPDQRRYNRLKELDAPEIILKSELEPDDCNYGIIINKKFQEQVENILQPLKIGYTILDNEQYFINDYKPNKINRNINKMEDIDRNKFFKELLKETNYSKEQCELIYNIWENTNIGDEDKIIEELINKLNIGINEANYLYDAVDNIRLKIKIPELFNKNS